MLPSPPFLTLAGVSNIRDVGGLELSTPHGKVRKGLIYRAAAPSQSSFPALYELGITAVFDLRSQGEAAKLPLASQDGVEYFLIPVFSDKDWSPEAMTIRWARTMRGDMVTGYRDILIAGGPSFGKIYKRLLESEEGLLVHCSAGKDRTGVAVAVLLALVGVDDQDIAKEYALTTLAVQEMSAALEKRIMASEAVQKLDESMRLDGVRNMLSSKPETIIALLNILRAEWGTVDEYVMKACGMEKDEVDSLKEKLIAKSSM
ncbi:protein-tyrosine phosphatase-like protein [Pyronema omphalodes]|nr:protein-tyrosine phosphatase-like protein [Pyronema omphalodes]